VTPSETTSGKAPTSLATTGMPWVRASMALMPAARATTERQDGSAQQEIADLRQRHATGDFDIGDLDIG